MIDEVCYYLGKSYIEVASMQKTFIRWHYINAMERQKREKEYQFEMQLAIQSPERYKAWQDKKKAEISNASFVETTDEKGQVVSEMDYETFKNIAKQYKDASMGSKVVEILSQKGTQIINHENSNEILIPEGYVEPDFGTEEVFFNDNSDTYEDEDTIFFDRSN